MPAVLCRALDAHMIRTAFVGAGAVADRHISQLETMKGVAVVAVCDLDERRARAAASPLSARAYTDAHRMLEEEDVEALFVCTPPGAHADPAVAALTRGVHVYLEKPIARALPDAFEIVHAWRSGGAVCAVGYQWRALDFLDAVQNELAGREVGLLISRNVSAAEGGRIEQARNAPPGNPPWFLNRETSGGILLELGSHDIDLQLALGGSVEGVHAIAGPVVLAQAGAAKTDLEDVLLLTLQFASGALGTIAIVWAGLDVPEFFELDVLADSAIFRIDLDPRFEASGQVDGKSLSLRATTHPLQLSVARFFDCVRRGDPGSVFCSPADGYETLAVALACEQSLLEGERVTVNRDPAMGRAGRGP